MYKECMIYLHISPESHRIPVPIKLGIRTSIAPVEGKPYERTPLPLCSLCVLNINRLVRVKCSSYCNTLIVHYLVSVTECCADFAILQVRVVVTAAVALPSQIGLLLKAFQTKFCIKSNNPTSTLVL